MQTNTTEDDCSCSCYGHEGRNFQKLILHQLMKFKDFFFCLSQIKDPYISQLESQEKLDEDDQEKEEEDGKNIGPVNVWNHRANSI